MLPDLPGKSAQLIMAPTQRVAELLDTKNPPADAKCSAVLVLLRANNYNWDLLLIERSKYNGHHSAQIAFPGGKCEKNDKSHADTALREANEEIGITPNKCYLIGELTQIYVPGSNFIIHPVLAVAEDLDDIEMQINHKEVVSTKWIPLKDLNPQEAKTIKVLRSNNEWSDAPAFIYEDYTVWGATAMILAELYQFVMPEAISRMFFKRPYISSSNPEI